MADSVGLPNRGQIHNVVGTTASQTTGLEGYEKLERDNVQVNAGPNTVRSSRRTLMRLVRNASGITLLPKRAVKWQTGFRGTRVDGYCTTTAEECAGIVDSWYSSTQVVNNALFWIARQGPALVLNDIASGAGTVIAEGGVVVALTAATSQATTAGRVVAQTLTGATAVLGGQIQNRIGKAMSAVTTANTNNDVLVDLELMP